MMKLFKKKEKVPEAYWYGFANLWVNGFKCTNCQGFSQYKSRICPHCGAKMKRK